MSLFVRAINKALDEVSGGGGGGVADAPSAADTLDTPALSDLDSSSPHMLSDWMWFYEAMSYSSEESLLQWLEERNEH